MHQITMIPKRDPDIEAYFYDSEYFFTDDIEMYLEMMQDWEGPVIEFASGSGRFLIPLAEKGFEVVGLDRSQQMTERARAKIKEVPGEVRNRIQLVVGDMRSRPVQEKFNSGLLIFNSLLLVESPAEQETVLRQLYDALRPGGRAIITCMNPHQDWMHEKSSCLKYYGTWVNKNTGGEFDRSFYNTIDVSRQRVQYNMIYDEVDGTGKVIRKKNPINLRYLYSFELQHILERTGFAVESVTGNYQFGPYESDSTVMIFVVSKPERTQ